MDPNVEKGPIEYFTIDASHPELKGDFVGEIINDEHGPSLHIVKEGGRRLSQPNMGDVAISGISEKGWDKIREVVGRLGPEVRMSAVKRAVTETSFITWDKASIGH